MRILLLPLLLAALAAPSAHAQTPAPKPMPQPSADPFIWLEDADSPRALAWAKGENQRTLGLLESDPRYAVLHQEALKIVDATDRIPIPGFRAGAIYNFWQDQTHAQGLWRRTTLRSYQTADPRWETVLDLDALSKAEGKTWVWKGSICLQPEQKQCLLQLSNGGEDAVEVREFDLPSAQFVQSGFTLPRGKQDLTWRDPDTLVVAREWGPRTMTESGYPFVVKLVKRGQPLEAAQEVFRGTPKDVQVSPSTLYDAQTGRKAVLITRAVSFFETETYLLTAQGTVKLPLPLKSTVQGLNGGHMLFTLQQDWTPEPGGRTISKGSLVAADLDELARGGTPKRGPSRSHRRR